VGVAPRRVLRLERAGQHSSTTQTIRAINQLYALIGGFDAPGGNVLFAGVPSNRVDGAELLAPAQRAKALGVAQRPAGPRPRSSSSPARTSTPRPSTAIRTGHAGW